MVGTFYHLQTLRGRLRQPLAAIEALQSARLRALVQHAWDSVPYYRDLMRQAGIRPADVRSQQDLRNLPVTDRSTWRHLPDDITMAAGSDPRRYQIRWTSGSDDGAPSRVLVGDDEVLERALVTIRSDIENGYRLWQRQGFVSRPPFRPDIWFKRLGILPSLYVSFLDDVGSQVERLRRFQPVRLNGRPSALMRIVAYCRQHGVVDLRPQLVSTIGERLLPEQRVALTEQFVGSVYDRYGATEGGILGWECEHHDGYHLNLDQVIVECVRGVAPAEPGEPGSVVLTNLAAYVQPLIRVTLGDVAVMAGRPCPCGRTWPRVARVLGRHDEFLMLPDGRWLTPQQVEATCGGVAGLSDYRVVQETPTRVRTHVVAPNDAAAPELVRQRLRALLGRDVEVVLEPRETLPLLPSGKACRVVNRVASRA